MDMRWMEGGLRQARDRCPDLPDKKAHEAVACSAGSDWAGT